MLYSLSNFTTNERITIIGRLSYTTYTSEDRTYTVNDFMVSKIIKGEETFPCDFKTKVTGNLLLERNIVYRIEGTIGEYKNVKNIKCLTYSFEDVKEKNYIISLLSSKEFKGVGKTIATNIYNKFGDDVYKIIEEDYLKLTEINKVSFSMAKKIHDAFIKCSVPANVIDFFKNHGIDPVKYTNFILEKYIELKDNLIIDVSQDPYFYLTPKIDLNKCDEIAKANNIKYNAYIRIDGYIDKTYRETCNKGDCFIYYDLFASEVIKYINRSVYTDHVKENEIKIRIDALVKQGKYVLDTFEGKSIVMNKMMFNVEVNIAENIKRISKKTSFNKDIENYINKYEKVNAILLEDKQKLAIATALRNQLFILIGSAGTGKTTSIKALLEVLCSIKGLTEEDIMIAAPTGKAARRAQEVSGYKAKTIHRMLGYKPFEFGYMYNRENPMPYKVVVIDETSMVDVFIFNSLLDAIDEDTYLILMGDTKQLKPVGAGNILADLLKNNVIPSIELDVIKRQAENSKIIFNSMKVSNGEDIDISNKSDFFYINKNKGQDIVNTLLKSIDRFISLGHKDIQVLSPQKGSYLGVNNLNNMLQEKLNPLTPGKNEVKIDNFILREGDKVMNMKNNYEIEHETDEELGVLNGDTGIIKHILEGNILVSFDDYDIIYNMNTARELLKLAYCVTVHKMQGSQSEIVIMCLNEESAFMLKRNLVYTAITRSQKSFVMIGPQEILKMILRPDNSVRLTKLSDRINTILSKIS